MEASGTAPELWTNEAGKTSPDAINCQARNCYTPKVARCMWISHRSRAINGKIPNLGECATPRCDQTDNPVPL